MALLQQPESKDLLEVPMGEDNPLHSIVCQHRPDKMDVLITFLTHSSVDVINTHGKGGMTALHYAVQVVMSLVQLGGLLVLFLSWCIILVNKSHLSISLTSL